MVKYNFNEEGQFIIEGYDTAKTFSSFLPGVAGIDGIPMWSFYVNRGQAMGSFGVKDKDSTIMEFFPANIMYRNIELNGFRTFIKYNNEIHEIFSSVSKDKVVRRMIIEKNILKIEELNETLKIKVLVTYFTMPREKFAAIVRKLEIENLDNVEKEIEVLDGLPQILAYGVTNTSHQAMGNLNRAWCDVFNKENKIPYYKLRATTNDSAEVGTIEQGNFYLGFSSLSNGLIDPIVDMDVIFGENKSLLYPAGWNCNIEELASREQVFINKISGGFTAESVALQDKYTLVSIIGNVANIDLINKIKDNLTLEYINKKEEEAVRVIDELVKDVYTNTSNKVFDEYMNQCYLDNILRGGYPLIFEGQDRNHVYHVYSRKHGDLEREYNFFSLEPAFYSQGNGNFRDVNQNRRNDILFNPKVEDFNVKQFMNLIQLDGYNPLVVKGSTFNLKKDAMEEILAYIKEDEIEFSRNEAIKNQVVKILSSNFTPGYIINYIIKNEIELTCSNNELLEKILKASTQNYEATFGEGYWSDHWTYNMDLVDSYLRIYPDKLKEFVFNEKSYRFFESPETVLPRRDKYVLINNKVRQYNSIISDKEKCEKLKLDKNGTNWVKDINGKIYETNLFVKLISLALNKFTILDPYGIGIEMEGDKPGWNDAMNGLPGLFGSSINETAELKRLVDFIIEVSSTFDETVDMPEEIIELLLSVNYILNLYKNNEINDYDYWDKITSLKEAYRQKVRFGLTGEDLEVSTSIVKDIFKDFANKIDLGLERAFEIGKGIYPTYLYYEAVNFEIIEGKRNPVSGYQNVLVKDFELKVLPYFLEGPCRTLKVLKDKNKAKDLYEKIKGSNIYDKKLKMYKTSEPIDNAPFEIGRAKAFTAGWLERESVFMHMEYKYLLEIIKAGLYEEFYEDIQTMLVPFLNPEVYGRSILENSSFIASSANPDKSVHGQGFVARLSGSTAEMISIWSIMMIGDKCFEYRDNELMLTFKPILPSWIFNNNKVSFNFLGNVRVTYNNEKNLNTFGENHVNVERIDIIYNNNRRVSIAGNEIKGNYAVDIRNGLVKEINITLN